MICCNVFYVLFVALYFSRTESKVDLIFIANAIRLS